MTWKKQNAKSVVLLHEYRDVYDTHHLRAINDAQLMVIGIIYDALLQAMPYIKAHADSVLWRYEILSGRLDVTFLIKYCSLLGLDMDC